MGMCWPREVRGQWLLIYLSIYKYVPIFIRLLAKSNMNLIRSRWIWCPRGPNTMGKRSRRRHMDRNCCRRDRWRHKRGDYIMWRKLWLGFRNRRFCGGCKKMNILCDRRKKLDILVKSNMTSGANTPSHDIVTTIYLMLKTKSKINIMNDMRGELVMLIRGRRTR